MPDKKTTLVPPSLQVPGDAFKMDFLFSDVESGEGSYDSRGGFDYHLPVEGSAVSPARWTEGGGRV